MHGPAGQAGAEQRVAVGAGALVPRGRPPARRRRRAAARTSRQARGELVDAGDQRVAVGDVDVGPDRAVGAGHAGRVAEARPDRRQPLGALARRAAPAAWATSRLASTCGRCETQAIRRSCVSGSIAVGPRAEARRAGGAGARTAPRRCCPRPGVRYQVAPSNRSSRACSTPARLGAREGVAADEALVGAGRGERRAWSSRRR